jgi:hypothetical protein
MSGTDVVPVKVYNGQPVRLGGFGAFIWVSLCILGSLSIEVRKTVFVQIDLGVRMGVSKIDRLGRVTSGGAPVAFSCGVFILIGRLEEGLAPGVVRRRSRDAIIFILEAVETP